MSAQHPDVVKRLRELAEVAREELGDGARKGRGVRPVGTLAVEASGPKG